MFADRTYQKDRSLTSRNQPDALITDKEQAVNQVVRMVQEGIVLSQQQIEIPLQANTICIHGDGEHAVEFAKYIHSRLAEHQILVRAIKEG